MQKISVSSLRPTIHSILSAPEADLQTISAKRVRKLLPELRSDISPEFVKANKEEINELIERIYWTLAKPDDTGEAAPSSSKRKREDTPEKDREDDWSGSQNGREEDQSYISKPVTKTRDSRPSDLTDEAYAKQLSLDLNQSLPRRTSRNDAKTKKNSTKVSKSKKSRTRITDSDDENGVDDDTTVTKSKASSSTKKSNGGQAKGGFSKEFTLSEPLSAVVGTTQLSRPQVVKRLWEYIRSRELQNPKDRREIFCDDSLRNLFSTDKINMFTMNKVLSKHLYELE